MNRRDFIKMIGVSIASLAGLGVLKNNVVGEGKLPVESKWQQSQVYEIHVNSFDKDGMERITADALRKYMERETYR